MDQDDVVWTAADLMGFKYAIIYQERPSWRHPIQLLKYWWRGPLVAYIDLEDLDGKE